MALSGLTRSLSRDQKTETSVAEYTHNPDIRRWRLKDHELEGNLDYSVRLWKRSRKEMTSIRNKRDASFQMLEAAVHVHNLSAQMQES